MKPDFIMTTSKTYRFPESKPKNYVNKAKVKTYLVWWQGQLIDAEWEQIDKKWGFKADFDDGLLDENEIEWFAEYPKEPDPSCEEYDFTTAVELAIQGIVSQSVVSGDLLGNGDIDNNTEYDMHEILGKWRLA